MRAWSATATLILTALVASWLAECSFAATPPQSAAPTVPAQLPRVRLIATGGTISNRSGGRLSAEELVASIPGIDKYVRPEFEHIVERVELLED